jgi:hypothetical protein
MRNETLKNKWYPMPIPLADDTKVTGEVGITGERVTWSESSKSGSKKSFSIERLPDGSFVTTTRFE